MSATQEQQQAAPLRRRHEKLGVVVSNKMQKTVVVEVQWMVTHGMYGKYLRKTSRFMAHDESNACKIGDKVRIEESRPLSRHKRWVVKEVLEKTAS
jgi:small subunit ribosomal protein S17